MTDTCLHTPDDPHCRPANTRTGTSNPLARMRARLQARASARTPVQQRVHAIRMNAALWTFQGWLAMFFIGAGYAKTTEEMRYLDVLLGWSVAVHDIAVRALGAAEILLGLLMLAPLLGWGKGRLVLRAAAAVLATTTAVMMVVHAIRLEGGAMAINALLFVLASATFYGRAIYYPGHPQNGQ